MSILLGIFLRTHACTRTHTGAQPTEAFGDGLDVPEGGFPGSGDEEPNGLIDAAQGRHIDGLPTHRTYTRTITNREVMSGDAGWHSRCRLGGVFGVGLVVYKVCIWCVFGVYLEWKAVDHIFSTCTTDTSGIFTRTTVDDGIGNDLEERNIRINITD